MKRKALFSILLLLLISCSKEEAPTGIVATVNGTYITLTELRNRYDVQTMHMSEFASPSIENLSQEYTETLFEMILEVILEQELIKNKIEVTDAIVDKAIEEIKGSYSDEEFSQVLAERYIDFNNWRKQIRAKVVEELFIKHIVSGDIQATEEEIKAFYNNNPSFFTPETKFTGNIISSSNKSDVEKAVVRIEKGINATSIMQEYPSVTVQSIAVDASNIPPEFLLESLKIALKKATAVQKSGNIYYSIFIVSRQKNVKLTFEEARDIAKEYVIEKKARTLYQSAVDAVLQNASIHVADEFKNSMDALLGTTKVSAQ